MRCYPGLKNLVRRLTSRKGASSLIDSNKRVLKLKKATLRLFEKYMKKHPEHRENFQGVKVILKEQNWHDTVYTLYKTM